MSPNYMKRLIAIKILLTLTLKLKQQLTTSKTFNGHLSNRQNDSLAPVLKKPKPPLVNSIALIKTTGTFPRFL